MIFPFLEPVTVFVVQMEGMQAMIWRLLTKILTDLLVGLIVELVLAAIMALFGNTRESRLATLA